MVNILRIPLEGHGTRLSAILLPPTPNLRQGNAQRQAVLQVVVLPQEDEDTTGAAGDDEDLQL